MKRGRQQARRETHAAVIGLMVVDGSIPSLHPSRTAGVTLMTPLSEGGVARPMRALDFADAIHSNFSPVTVTIVAHHRAGNEPSPNLVAYIVGRRSSAGSTEPLTGSGLLRYSDRNDVSEDPFRTDGADPVSFVLGRVENAIALEGGAVYTLTISLDESGLSTTVS